MSEHVMMVFLFRSFRVDLLVTLENAKKIFCTERIDVYSGNERVCARASRSIRAEKLPECSTMPVLTSNSKSSPLSRDLSVVLKSLFTYQKLLKKKLKYFFFKLMK